MRKLIGIFILITAISGCKSETLPAATNNTVSPSAAASTLAPSTPISKLISTPQIQSPLESKIIQESPNPTLSPAKPIETAHRINEDETTSNETITLGEYIIANESPINLGNAIVTSRGNDLYHLKVSVSRGLNHHEGYIESDFNLKSGKVSLLENEYSSAVTVVFSGNKITIDYPDSEHHGGINAEPKGEYYLKKTDLDDNTFMKNLFDSFKLDQQYRNGFTDVYVTSVMDQKQLLLLQSWSSVNRGNIVSENVVVYNEKESKFQYIGEISSYEIKKLSDKLVDLGFNQEIIYNTLRKNFNDRYLQIRMKNYDSRGKKALDDLLTEEEAFYIVTGNEEKTGISDNHRDKDNIGSILKTEVHHSDDKIVTIHKYEEVRNDDKDTHTVTSDWITVDRLSGEVKGLLE